MSNYTQTVLFGLKDILVSGDANKLVIGAQLDTELDAINTAIATKIEGTGVACEVTTGTFTPSWVGISPSGDIYWQKLISDTHGWIVFSSADGSALTATKVGAGGVSFGNIPSAAQPTADTRSMLTCIGWNDGVNSGDIVLGAWEIDISENTAEMESVSNAVSDGRIGGASIGNGDTVVGMPAGSAIIWQYELGSGA